MAYLIDTSCLIDCKNDYYDFDICPGFWDWLELMNRERVIFSVQRCREEITDGTDRLAEWARQNAGVFFLPVDNSTITSMKRILAWIENDTPFERHVKNRFNSKADPFLIGCALAHGHTIITHETFDPHKLKIPTVCRSFDVQYTSIYKLLKDTGAKFIFEQNTLTDGENYAE